MCLIRVKVPDSKKAVSVRERFVLQVFNVLKSHSDFGNLYDFYSSVYFSTYLTEDLNK